MAIIPVARSLFVCESVVGYHDGKLDLYGIFNAIRPANGFPHTHRPFCAFAQLTNGLGQVPCFMDIRFAPSKELVFTTETRNLTFPDRHTIVQVAMNLEGCTFPHPGLYHLEVFCDNTWVCDTELFLREPRRK